MAQNHNIHTSWLWHLHQPIYWPDKRTGSDHYENAWDTIQAQDGGRQHPSPENLRQVFGLDDRIAAYQYRPKDALNSVTWLGHAGVQLNYSGALMENIQSLGAAGQYYGSNWYQSNHDAKTWATTGGKPRMDLTNFTYHHSLAPLLSDETLEMELRIHKRHMQLLWGDPTSRGYFPAETCFSERIIPILKKVDISWSIIANNHLSRACTDFPLVLGSGGENCDIPNKADQINPAQGSGNYQRLSIDRGMSPAAAMPFAFQTHYARYVDPGTGAESKIIVVPSDQALGWKDSYSTWDVGLLDPLNARNNTNKPSLALFAHDGDNAWSGGFSYYMEWVNSFAGQANSRSYEPTTVEQFLADWPVDTNDVVHVEDGGWVYADGDFGSPIFVNWHFPPSHSVAGVNVVDPTIGVSDKADVWRVIVATENRVKTAQQISAITPRIDQVRDPGSFSTAPNNVELAWHYYLAGLDSGFVYYGCHDDECQRPVISQTNAEREIGSVLSNPNQDTTPPTVFIPQRHPWNPGGQNYGVQYSYRSTTPANTDFWVWTYVYDVSGVATVKLKYRSNGNNHPPTQDEFKTYAGGPDTGAWNNIDMTKRVVAPVIGASPQFIADYYHAKITGLSDTYVDYYVTATDSRGNTFNSPIQHVYVATNPGGTPTPTPTPTATPTPSPTPTPSSTPIPFTLDGQADSAGYLQFSNGMTIYAAVRGGILYLATWSPGSSGGPNDHFIFVSDQLLASASAPAPWAKTGMVAVAANKPFLAGESLSAYCGWFNAPSSSQVVKSPINSGQIEGVIDLAAAFGSVPQTVYVCAAAYSTADGDVLAAQGPSGNGDGNIDPNEFMALSIPAIKDENADGKYDRLDPALDFIISQVAKPNGAGITITWNSVPGKTYAVESADQLGGPWTQLGNNVTAGPGQITLPMTDSLSFSRRFYRVNLVNPGAAEYGKPTVSSRDSRDSKTRSRERARSKTGLRTDKKARRS